jgi:uncharacterized membrane protein
MGKSALFVGAIAALSAIFLIVAAIALPQTVERLLTPVPAKFLAILIGLVLISILSSIAYWSFQLPRTARVALGLLRACLAFTATSIATPFSIFGLQSLSLVINQRASLNINWNTSLSPSAAIVAVTLTIAFFSLREYRNARIYEHAHGLSDEI